MKITVLGATGRVGALTVEKLLLRGFTVRVLVRNPEKARARFGGQANLEILAGQLDDPATVVPALTGVDAAFVALGSVGVEGELQKAIIAAAKAAELPQYVRLSVLNTSHRSIGINQRSHAKIDDAAEAAGIPYTTIRPAIFSAAILSGANEIKRESTWTGLAQHGHVGLIDYRDVADTAAAILEDHDRWGKHWDLTGPRLINWPELVELLSAELRGPVAFRAVDEETLFSLLTGAGVPEFQARLLVARELAVEAGENERLTDNVALLSGHRPRTVEEFLHDNRDAFLPLLANSRLR